MTRRFVSIWFRHLLANRTVRKQPNLKGQPFVLATPIHGRMVVKALSREAGQMGIRENMVVADGRAILPELIVLDYVDGEEQKILTGIAEWCIRFTPVAATCLPDGVTLNASGCCHLWGGEEQYLSEIKSKLDSIGYDVRLSMADTIGASWAMARFGASYPIVPYGMQSAAIMSLPPAALRLDTTTVQRLEKLGLYQIKSFANMPRRALIRRFGNELILKLDQALGLQIENLNPVCPIVPYQERLPCLEPIRTVTGIEIALEKLLVMLCSRLERESVGLRRCIFKGYRIDGNVQQIEIGTSRATRNTEHLFKLLKLKIGQIMPALGIELFVIDAPLIEELTPAQETLWSGNISHDEAVIGELLDRIAGKVGTDVIHRYIPQEHYWPERSYKTAITAAKKVNVEWTENIPRPIQILSVPEQIEVMVQIPDYPPIQFIYKGKIHKVRKADGPERIEREWWIEQGEYRDYYCVEDEVGARYWLYRSGNYNSSNTKWFLHGFFA